MVACIRTTTAKKNSVLVAAAALCVGLLSSSHDPSTTSSLVNGFSTLPTTLQQHQHQQHVFTSTTPLHMVAAASSSSDNFLDDFHNHHGDESSSSSSSFTSRVQQEPSDEATTSKFVTGDDLHRLRSQVLAMRLELQEARRNANSKNNNNMIRYEADESSSNNYCHKVACQQRVQELERAIMMTQQVDAEFVYTVSLERKELAEKEGNLLEAQRFLDRAMEARAALPQFNLEGLWVGKYGEHGYEMINITYQGDILLAQKVTGTKNVPKGEVTFQVDLSPRGGDGGSSGVIAGNNRGEFLSPIELGDSAAKQWGCKYLQRFAGKGQVAAEGYLDSQWVDGQLIMVNEYFSFAWLPIGHQVFFGRPTPELILKLMKDEKKKEVGDCSARAFLERCWEETEHIEDDMEVNNEGSIMSGASHDPDRSFYYQEGCFE